jgi:hypothetical protein
MTLTGTVKWNRANCVNTLKGSTKWGGRLVPYDDLTPPHWDLELFGYTPPMYMIPMYPIFVIVYPDYIYKYYQRE